jgi:hypothetical protein
MVASAFGWLRVMYFTNPPIKVSSMHVQPGYGQHRCIAVLRAIGAASSPLNGLAEDLDVGVRVGAVEAIDKIGDHGKSPPESM